MAANLHSFDFGDGDAKNKDLQKHRREREEMMILETRGAELIILIFL